MLKKSRPDGTWLPNLPHFVRLQPYLIEDRISSTIFFEQEFDLTHTLAYLGKFNRSLPKGERKISFFQIFLCAAVRTIAQRPRMNRFISGHNYYQRNEIIFNFVAKKELNDRGDEINVTIPFTPFETLSTLPPKVIAATDRALHGDGTDADRTNELLCRLPRWLIKLVIRGIKFLDYHNLLPASFLKDLPFYASVFFTNVGSIGVDAPFHHHFNIGTCGLFIALGKVRRQRCIGDDGQVQTHDLVKVVVTFDDRICDGIYGGKSIELFKYYTEHPEELETAPTISQETLAELQLKSDLSLV